MDRMRQSSKIAPASAPDFSVPAYYEALTDPMVTTTGDLLAVHYGLWGPDTTSYEEALLRSNCMLVQECDPGPGKRFLDAGCGVGGTAIALAEMYGAQVTGLTNCEPHVAVAAEFAQRRGVGHLVEFHYGDFMDMPFPDASFDAVLNQETFWYAQDRLAYLGGVRRVLKPGGRWRALDMMLAGRPMSETQEVLHANIQKGWLTQPLVEWREISAELAEAGFAEIREHCLASEVAPSTAMIRSNWLLRQFLTSPGREPTTQKLALTQWMQAAVEFDQGLREGLFTYRLMSGTRPAQESVLPERFAIVRSRP